MKSFRNATIIFMLVGTVGFIIQAYLLFTPTTHRMLRSIAGMGYGLCFGAAMVQWWNDLKKLSDMAREMAASEALYKRHATTLPTFTCPDCKIVSYNPNDIKYSYCGNCHEFKE